VADHLGVRRLAPLVLLIGLALAPAASAGEIVVLERTADPVATETAEREAALGFDAERRFSRAVRGFAADLTPEQVQALREDPEVAMVVPDRPVRALAAVPAKSGERVPPGVRRSLAAPAGTVREAATGAVAVLDSGVDLDHPDLDVVAGANCIAPGTPPDDVHGHGTHVAGTVAARNNGAGVTGVAPGTKIVAVKVLGDTGSGTTSSVLCGIDYVLANAARLGIGVANFSLGGDGQRSTCATDAEHAAFCALTRAGITPVVAAGNEGTDFGTSAPDVPAAYAEVLTVAAMVDTDGVPGGSGAKCGTADADDAHATFSNYAVDAAERAHLVAAPGACILSTARGGGTTWMSGTSMAAPHVAALVALCRARPARRVRATPCAPTRSSPTCARPP
jgi:subtilisin family serine protease